MDVEAQMADGSNCSFESRARSESNQIPKEKVKLQKPHEGSGHKHDYAALALNSEWDYDFLNNKGDSIEVQKAQYAYYKWNEELKESRLLEGLKKADISELWTGVYQIIGFYSVFQGVIYQGTTAMSSVLTCDFYRIPVILSVLASAATIVGIYMKLSQVFHKKKTLYEDSTRSTSMEKQIEACREINVKEFSIAELDRKFKTKETTVKKVADTHEHELQKARYLKWAVLVFLTAFSTLFSYLDYIVMCRDYS